MKKNNLRYLIINTLLTLLVPIIITIFYYINGKTNILDSYILISSWTIFILSIFTGLIYIISNTIILKTLILIINYLILILVHLILYKNKYIRTWYIYSILFTLINFLFGIFLLSASMQ